MKPVLLMVTWFYFGEPPQTSHVEFASMDSCLMARGEILHSALRLKNDAQIEAQQAFQRGIDNLAYLPAPTVSAVCAPQ